MNENDEILEEKENKKIKSKNRFLITYSIWFSVIFIIFILSLIFFNRLLVFGKIFYNYGGAIQIIGLMLYILSLFLLLAYYGYTLTIIILKRRKHEDWYPELSKLFSKLDLPSFVLKCISVLLFIFIFMFNPCTVAGHSMEDTFYDSDKVIASSFTSLKRDDIIIFDASNYSHSEAFYIKRIIAIEGDTISYKDGELYINDVKDSRGNVREDEYNRLLKSALYLKALEDDKNAKYDDIVTIDIETAVIPKNKFLVLGDNRKNSSDSRIYGLIDESDIYGEVIMRFFPFSEFKFF